MNDMMKDWAKSKDETRNENDKSSNPFAGGGIAAAASMKNSESGRSIRDKDELLDHVVKVN